jgi:hypothetical protein
MRSFVIFALLPTMILHHEEETKFILILLAEGER